MISYQDFVIRKRKNGVKDFPGEDISPLYEDGAGHGTAVTYEVIGKCFALAENGSYSYNS